MTLIMKMYYCRFNLKTTGTLRIPKTTAPTKMYQGIAKCSIPGALVSEKNSLMMYQVLAEKDIRTGLAMAAIAAPLVFALLNRK